MIGVFGRYQHDSEAPADISPIARQVANRMAVDADNDTGGALGRVAHDLGFASGRAQSADGTAVICGEIFNPEAFEDLQCDNAAAIILALVRNGDHDRLAAVNGQFCAAVYDRTAHRLSLITDRLATHPLHVWRGPNATVFATQLYHLIGDAEVPRRADPLAMAQLMTTQRTVGRVTPLAGVDAMPAATVLEIDKNGGREISYWTLEWRRPAYDRHDGAVRLASALRTAVGRQNGNGSTGLMLSGGVDSRMILAAADGQKPACWTTASFAENSELALARKTAAAFGAPHETVLVPPCSTIDVIDQGTIATGGCHPASTPIAAFMNRLTDAPPALLSGHGLDYTLRGYYLPSRFAVVAGSRTRLPALRSIPRRPSGRDVLTNLRQGPPFETLKRIVRPERWGDWWRDQADCMDETLRPWLKSDDPYNAWDGFILHAVSKHYAFSGMMAVRDRTNLRLPAFDNDLFDVYLSMPPAWRCSGRMTQNAMRHLSREVARLPNANTGFRADLHPWLEIAALMGRGALRRLGLARRPRVPSAAHSDGSWQDTGGLYRTDPGFRNRFGAMRGRLDELSLGLFDTDALAACIDEHLDGRRQHTKLLRQLLSHEAWIRCFGIIGLA